MKTYTEEEIEKENKNGKLLIIIENKVYDVTEFQNNHPGGKKILQKVGGKDATEQFWKFHNQAILDKYTPKLCIGTLEADIRTNKETEDGEQNEYDRGEGLFGDLVPFGDPNWYQGWASPYYNETHIKLRLSIRQFVEKEIDPFVFEWDEAKKIPPSIFIKCADNGMFLGCCGSKEAFKYADKTKIKSIFGVKLEEFDPLHELIMCDELSRTGSGGLTWGIIGGMGIGLPPIINFASEEMKKRIVPDCVHGRKFACLAITEPSGGSDVANILTEAKLSKDGKHYIINGQKKWITNGVFAEYFTTAVRTGGSGMKGVSLLLIERNMKGVSTRQMDCTGVWASGTAYINFEDVKVPVENIIGEVNKGFKYIMYNFNHERLGLVIMSSRFSRVCYEQAMKYAHKRKTFDKLLIEHPVIRDKFANMARQIEATHAWLEAIFYQTKIMPKEEQMIKLGGPIALLKAQATKTFEYCAREAAQIYGGLSYSRGGQAEKVERLNREVRAFSIPGGSEEIMLDLGMRQSIKVAKFAGSKM